MILSRYLFPVVFMASLFCTATAYAQNQVVFKNLLDEDATIYILKPGEKFVIQRKNGQQEKYKLVTADSSGLSIQAAGENAVTQVSWTDIAAVQVPDGISRQHWLFRAGLLGGGVAVAALSYSLKLPGVVFLAGAAVAAVGLAGIIHGTVKLIVRKKINLTGKGWTYSFQPDKIPQTITK